nr:immunoglobulin heavy chain junction region [Macaca mulatta]MOW92553.1 immunoglobulin heavy chain junction region [Macaca mulatta]
CARQDSDYDSW